MLQRIDALKFIHGAFVPSLIARIRRSIGIPIDLEKSGPTNRSNWSIPPRDVESAVMPLNRTVLFQTTVQINSIAFHPINLLKVL